MTISSGTYAPPPNISILEHSCAHASPTQAVAIASVFTKQCPNEPFGWTILAESYYRTRNFPAAKAAAEQAVFLNPNSASAYSNLGAIYKKVGCLAEAESSLRRALQCDPYFLAAYLNLGSVLRELQRFAEAEAFCRRAIDLAPDRIEPLYLLANISKDAGRSTEAETLYRKVIHHTPTHVEAHSNLGLLLRELGRHEEAEVMLRRAIQLAPSHAMSHIRLAFVLADLDQTTEAERCFRTALAYDPTSEDAVCNLMFLHAYAGSCNGEVLRRDAQNWCHSVFPQNICRPATKQQFPRSPSTGRPLRVGILSAEFGFHSAYHLMKSWLWNFDPCRISLRLYPVKLLQHPELNEIAQTAGRDWIPLVGLDDEQAAERLRRDELDILLETSGHTQDSRLGITARRVAPVQCHFLGYFASTGLESMDYFIGDQIVTPPEHSHHFVETLWQLSRTRFAYDPINTAPEPSWQPDPDGRLRLGSFNNLEKVRSQSLTLWAQVLRSIPDAVLVLRSINSANKRVRARIIAALEQFGVEGRRVEFYPYCNWYDHMCHYNAIDIALDTIPFNSGVTACHALWMGTPLVTLIGQQLIRRQSASILTGLGRPKWIAYDSDQFVEIVTALASNDSFRKELRQSMRQEMATSELCDGKSLARALEESFVTMFNRWENTH